MWTRGRDKDQPGAFAFELWEGRTLIERRGGFATAQEADRAAEMAQRRLTFPPMPDDEALSLEELRAALSDLA